MAEKKQTFRRERKHYVSTVCFFDFDGTLADSSEGILNAYAHAFRSLGLAVPPLEKLSTLIGPPLLRNLTEGCGLDLETAERGAIYYREFYRDRGINECRLYDGISDMLRNLSREASLVIATCKPEPFALRSAELLDVKDLFVLVAGANPDGTRGEKAEVIAHAMKVLGITNPDDVLMVGDRANDVLGAAEVGVSCLGVLWGFGSEQELLEAGAKAVLSSPLELETFLKKWISLRKK